MIDPIANDIGRKAIYKRGDPPFEEGVITFFNDHYVFLRYGKDIHSKATRREDLEWVTEPKGD